MAGGDGEAGLVFGKYYMGSSFYLPGRRTEKHDV